jgi:hypothetical protein
MNAVIAACCAAPLVAIGVYDLQSWLERWDYERHREDWRANLRYVEVVAIGPILDEGLTFNPSTLAARWLLGAEEMIHNRAMAHLTMGATTTMKDANGRG